VVVGK
jgi:hypothetical protein